MIQFMHPCLFFVVFFFGGGLLFLTNSSNRFHWQEGNGERTLYGDSLRLEGEEHFVKYISILLTVKPLCEVLRLVFVVPLVSRCILKKTKLFCQQC